MKLCSDDNLIEWKNYSTVYKRKADTSMAMSFCQVDWFVL